MTTRSEGPPRKRLTAEEARERILEAAERKLAEVGPEGLRLTDLAGQLGVSHPAILHHFGSREALMRELSRHAFAALNADLVEALEKGSSGDFSAWLDQVFETLGDQGHARLLAWGTLTGRLERGAEDDDPHLLLELARAVQERRAAVAARGGEGPPDLEETVFAVRLVAAALLGDALFEGVLRRSAGAASDRASRERFRHWLAEQVDALLVPRP